MSRMGQDLIEAMQEALNHSENKIKLRTTRLKISPVKESYKADEIKNIRKGLNMSQEMFAFVIGVSKKTVESWETGRYSPEGPARRLITVLQKDPGFPEKYDIVQK